MEEFLSVHPENRNLMDEIYAAHLRGDVAQVDILMLQYQTPTNHPLICAILGEDIKQVKFILESYQRWFDCAETRDLVPMKIVSNSLDAASPIGMAINRKQSEIFELLLNFGLRNGLGGCWSTCTPDRFGGTPFHHAVTLGQLHIMETLIQRCHLDIDSEMWGKGITALVTAASFNHFDTVRLLKAFGANTNIEEVLSRSPFGGYISPRVFDAVRERIPEDVVLEIRTRVYFQPTFLDRLSIYL